MRGSKSKSKPTETKAAELIEKEAVNPAEDKKTESVTKSEPVKAGGRKLLGGKGSAAKAETEKTSSDEKKTARKSDVKPDTKVTEETAKKKTVKRKVSDVPDTKPVAKKVPPKPISIETICEKVEKKIDKTKAADIGKTIAADIEVWGFEDGSNHHMFIEIKDGNTNVQPHVYNDKTFRVAISFANAVAFVNGKKTLEDLINDPEGFFAEGNIVDAIKLSKIF